MAEPQLKKRIKIPAEFDEPARKKLGENIIQHIVERTDKNKDIDGKKFAPYSKTYIESPEFKAAGKSKTDVNLRLTEEMMSSIQLLETGKGYVTIGFEDGTDANDKGVWNQRSDNGPSRMFLGISDKDLEIVIEKTKLEMPTKELVKETAGKLLKKLGVL